MPVLTGATQSSQARDVCVIPQLSELCTSVSCLVMNNQHLHDNCSQPSGPASSYHDYWHKRRAWRWCLVSLPLGSSRLHLCPELSSSDRVLCSTDQEIKERKLSKIFITIKRERACSTSIIVMISLKHPGILEGCLFIDIFRKQFRNLP